MKDQQKNGSIQISPSSRESSIAIPLSTQSAHPKHVHKSWMISQIRNMSRITTSIPKAIEAKSKFIELLENHVCPKKHYQNTEKH